MKLGFVGASCTEGRGLTADMSQAWPNRWVRSSEVLLFAARFAGSSSRLSRMPWPWQQLERCLYHWGGGAASTGHNGRQTGTHTE